MSYKHHAKKPQLLVNPSSDHASSSTPTNAISHNWHRITHLIEVHRYADAIKELRKETSSPRSQNALAVCLLRTSQPEEAVAILRPLVLSPGMIFMRPETRLEYKINFATALLLRGLPNGCISALREINQPSHPMIVSLESAIQRWVNQLPLWSKFWWHVGRVDPDNCSVAIDFAPGLLPAEDRPAESTA